MKVSVRSTGAAAIRRLEPNPASAALREELARRTARISRLVHAEQIVPTHGASAELATTISSLVHPGDKVLLPEPTYSLYADQLAVDSRA